MLCPGQAPVSSGEAHCGQPRLDHYCRTQIILSFLWFETGCPHSQCVAENDPEPLPPRLRTTGGSAIPDLPVFDVTLIVSAKTGNLMFYSAHDWHGSLQRMVDS